MDLVALVALVVLVVLVAPDRAVVVDPVVLAVQGMGSVVVPADPVARDTVSVVVLVASAVPVALAVQEASVVPVLEALVALKVLVPVWAVRVGWKASGWGCSLLIL